jgi:glycosyltransferase involved in cell wall biosynthesis
MKLHVFNKLPTPYADDLFRAMDAADDIELQVHHLWRRSSRRPWKLPLGEGYPNRYMETRLGLDWPSLRLAIADRDSLWMIADWAHPPAQALLLSRIARGAPVALWVDTPQEHLHRPWWKRGPRKAFLRWLLRNVDATFGSGEPARRVLLEMGAPPESIVDLQYVVDLGRPAAARARNETVARARELRARVGCGERGTVFIMSGQIELSKKAQDIGLEAFVRASHAAREPVGVLIAGTGPDEQVLKGVADRLGIRQNVQFLGWQEADEMDAVYLAGDALFHPANYDPFPLVVMESMSFGRCVVGTSTSGSVEQRVEDGVNGYVVNPGDIDSIASGLSKIVDDPEHRELLKRAARETAETWPISRAVEIVRCTMKRLLKSH